MEQAITATWAELLAAAVVVAIIAVGVIWALIGIYFNDLKRSHGVMQTELDGVRFAATNLAVAITEMKASMSTLAGGMTESLNGMDRLRGDVDLLNSNVARIATFLGHLAATPPSFPPDLK
jgi:hypothetical protein